MRNIIDFFIQKSANGNYCTYPHNMQNANFENLIKTNFKSQFVIIKGNQMIKNYRDQKNMSQNYVFF